MANLLAQFPGVMAVPGPTTLVFMPGWPALGAGSRRKLEFNRTRIIDFCNKRFDMFCI